MKKPKLTIIILNHNTKELLKDCLTSVFADKSKVSFEIIVSDNESTDGSVEMIRKTFPQVKILTGPNVSFANGNNRVKNYTRGDYVLFLNSDTKFINNVLDSCVDQIEKDKNIGALSCKLVLADGKLDRDCRRRFPTPWISINRLFLGNGKKYWYADYDENQTHEVDAIQGAFFLTRKKILDEVGWFDENYLFDGEDLDLSFQIKKLGYKIIYFPKVRVLHYKGATRGKIKTFRKFVTKDLIVKRRMEGVNAMEYFYKKNMWNKYPLLLNLLVISGIKLIKFYRYIKVKYL